MVQTVLPGTRVSLDPESIEKVDICCADGTVAVVRISLKDDGNHHSFEFPDKAAAIDFYRAVWQLRGGERLEDREIESLLVTERAELA